MNKSLVNILIIVVVAVVLFGVLRFLNSQNVNVVPNVPIKENFEASSDIMIPPSLEDSDLAPYNSTQPAQVPGVNTPQLSARELLPQDTVSNEWAQSNPSGNGSLKDKNFLQAGHLIGINTVGQTLRNANLQLRSDPPNPQTKVSPWLQSTISQDTNRQPLEIGCGAL